MAPASVPSRKVRRRIRAAPDTRFTTRADAIGSTRTIANERASWFWRSSFRLSGFTSAHFDGHQKTNVALGLSPGGQTFDAIADIDDSATGGLNVLANAHVGALPASMEVTFDPDNGSADYTASSVIPLLTASFTDRTTQMFGNAKLTDLPKNIGLTFNTSGGTPQITYDADSRLGSIEAGLTALRIGKPAGGVSAASGLLGREAVRQ